MVSIGSTMCLDIFVFFVHHVSANFTNQLDTEEVNLSPSDMPSKGLAKVRHVGRWAIRKELEHSHRFICSKGLLTVNQHPPECHQCVC